MFPFPKNKSRFALEIWRKFQCRAEFIGFIHYRKHPNIAEEICEYKVQAQGLKFHKQLNIFLTNIICLIYGIYTFQSNLICTVL